MKRKIFYSFIGRCNLYICLIGTSCMALYRTVGVPWSRDTTLLTSNRTSISRTSFTLHRCPTKTTTAARLKKARGQDCLARPSTRTCPISLLAPKTVHQNRSQRRIPTRRLWSSQTMNPTNFHPTDTTVRCGTNATTTSSRSWRRKNCRRCWRHRVNRRHTCCSTGRRMSSACRNKFLFNKCVLNFHSFSLTFRR